MSAACTWIHARGRRRLEQLTLTVHLFLSLQGIE